jgi:hypothetical protein
MSFSSKRIASSCRRLASAPYFGCSRICGQRPESSHAVKKKVQSMYGTSAASDCSPTKRRPRKLG